MNREQTYFVVLDVVVEWLHYDDNRESTFKMKTATEVQTAIEGGRARYKTDALFRARVQSFTAAVARAITSK